MKTLYLDIFSGISGDMFIGAMLDIGAGFEALDQELGKLGLEGYHLHFARASRQAIEGVKFDVHVGDHHHSHEEERHGHGHDHHHHDHGHGHDHHHHDHDHEPGHHHHERAHGRSYREIRELIATSRLSPWVKEKSIAVFERIAKAEGKIHGMPAEEVHFHEVGAVDSIVDVVGACICLELLGKPRVEAAPVVDGFGWIHCAHGRFPIPAPATLEILAQRGVSISQTDEPQELITPTGAALLAEFVDRFGPMRQLAVESVGFGLGARENKTRPNVLRAVLGKAEAAYGSGSHDWEIDTVAVVEANLDDINAEILGHFVERALSEGALDVFHTPVQMKKNRPGVLLTVLCDAADRDKFAELVLRETTSFGVRLTLCERRKLQREIVRAQTSFGEIEVKIGRLNGKAVHVAPEFESCRKASEKAGAPLKTVYEAALRATNA